MLSFKKMRDKQHLCFSTKVCEWLFSICSALFGSLLALHAHQVKTFAFPLPVQLGRLLRRSPKWGQSATELVPSDLWWNLPNHRQPMINLLLPPSNKCACHCTQLTSVEDMRKSLFVQHSVLVLPLKSLWLEVCFSPASASCFILLCYQVHFQLQESCQLTADGEKSTLILLLLLKKKRF